MAMEVEIRASTRSPCGASAVGGGSSSPTWTTPSGHRALRGR